MEIGGLMVLRFFLFSMEESIYPYSLNIPVRLKGISLFFLLVPLSLNHLRHVAVVDANHQRHRLLKHAKADEHDDGAKHIVLPLAKIVRYEVGHHQSAYHQFQPGCGCTRSVEVLCAEQTDAHGVDKALDDTKGGNNHRYHRHIMIDERHNAQQEQQDASRNTAGTLDFITRIYLCQPSNQVDKATWIVALFPLMQDEEESVNHYQFLNHRQLAHHGSVNDKEHSQYGVNLQCVKFDELCHNRNALIVCDARYTDFCNA